jgi:lauroyl/myristoyl acyltransferase
MLARSPSRSGRNLRSNARLVLGKTASDDEVRLLARSMACSMQRAIAEVLQSANRTSEELLSTVAGFSGQAEYHHVRRQRPGMLLASIHMGSFEPCLALLRRYEPRIHVLYHADPMPRFEKARSAIRSRLGIIEHRVSDGLEAWHALQRALEEGDVVVMHADRTMPGQSGTAMRFLSREDVVLPTGPVRLAVSVGAPVVPVFCRHTPAGLQVEMRPPITHDAELLRAGAAAGHPTQVRLVAEMERAILADPGQWMAFGQLNGGAW